MYIWNMTFGLWKLVMKWWAVESGRLLPYLQFVDTRLIEWARYGGREGESERIYRRNGDRYAGDVVRRSYCWAN
jgi:hypothetical protein